MDQIITNEVNPVDFEKDQEVVAIIKKDIPGLVEQVGSLEIADTKTQSHAVDLKAQIKKHLKAIEEKRKFYTVPLNDIKKMIDG